MIVDELIADGFTDYLVQPIIYTTGETNAASWSSKADGGFSDEAALVLERINQPLARLTEAYPAAGSTPPRCCRPMSGATAATRC